MLDATEGFAKGLISTEHDTILVGLTSLDLHAGICLPFVRLAMTVGLSYIEVADMIITQRTLDEGLLSFFMNVPPHK